MEIKKLSPELKKILAGALPIDSEATFKHELKSFKELIKEYSKTGVEIPEYLTPVFEFKSLPNGSEGSALKILNKLNKFDYSDTVGYRKLVLEMCNELKKVLVDWSVYELDSGEKIPFDVEKLKTLPNNYMQELFYAVCRVSGYLIPEDPKKEDVIKEGL